jgi:type IV secretory pathway VirB2 component (pilin)
MFHLPAGLVAFGKALCSASVAPRLLFSLLFIVAPHFAHAEAWDDGANSILDAARTIIRPLAILAIIGCGIGAGMGMFAWKTAGQVAGGIFIAVGADAIYDYFSSAVA